MRISIWFNLVLIMMMCYGCNTLDSPAENLRFSFWQDEKLLVEFSDDYYDQVKGVYGMPDMPIPWSLVKEQPNDTFSVYHFYEEKDDTVILNDLTYLLSGDGGVNGIIGVVKSNNNIKPQSDWHGTGVVYTPTVSTRVGFVKQTNEAYSPFSQWLEHIKRNAVKTQVLGVYKNLETVEYLAFVQQTLKDDTVVLRVVYASKNVIEELEFEDYFYRVGKGLKIHDPEADSCFDPSDGKVFLLPDLTGNGYPECVVDEEEGYATLLFSFKKKRKHPPKIRFVNSLYFGP